MGPIDSAIYPSPSYRCEETIGLRCFVMTSGAGSLVGSIEPATAGTNAAAINNIGRSEASSREYSLRQYRCRQKSSWALEASARLSCKSESLQAQTSYHVRA